MDWKAWLALAVFAVPLAYCEIKTKEMQSVEKIACIEARGDWFHSRCNFPK